MNVLLTGATGFVGRRLERRLQGAGHHVATVSRRPGADHDWSDASLARGIATADAVIHLAGAGLFDKRWNTAYKQQLVESRVRTTQQLARLVADSRCRTLITASAIGYYGASETPGLDETSPPGQDFLARLCVDWEAATAAASAAGARVAHVRIGVVLGLGGGALARMLPPFKLGLGGPIGSGRQWVSWVHIDDVCGLIEHLLGQPAAAGAFNATSPQPVDMKGFTSTLGRVLHRPAVLPVPGFAMRLLLGEVASVLLDGQHVLPRRSQAAGYVFEHAQLEGALGDLLGRGRAG